MKIGEKDELIVNGHKIKCIQASREGPKALPWKEPLTSCRRSSLGGRDSNQRLVQPEKYTGGFQNVTKWLCGKFLVGKMKAKICEELSRKKMRWEKLSNSCVVLLKN